MTRAFTLITDDQRAFTLITDDVLSSRRPAMKPYTENLRSSTDEVARNKALPRRQPTDKPLLRYDGGRAGQSFREVGAHPDSRSHPGSATATPTRFTAHNGVGSGGGGSDSAQRRMRNGSTGSGHSSRGSLSPGDDAFSRPLSAKEAARDYPPGPHRRRQVALYRGGAGAPVVSPYSALHKGLADDASSLQLCTFLRPAAGVYYDSISTKITPQKREHSALSQSAGEGVESGGSAQDSGQFVPGKIPGPKLAARLPGPSDTFTKTMSQSYAFSATAPGVNHPAGSGLPSPAKDPCPRDRAPDPSVPPASTGDNSSHHSLVHDAPFSASHCGHGSENDGCHKNARPDLAGKGAKPLSGSACFNSAQSFAEGSKAKGRILMGGGPVDPSPGSADLGLLAGVDESGLPLHNLTASSLLNTRLGVLRQKPGARPSPGHMHLKKSLLEASLPPRRAVPVLLEQRPCGDGAPAKHATAALHEKSPTVGCGQEEEEDDSSVPSGERLPGDGEASDNDLGNDDDDDGIDDLYDDCQDDADGADSSDDYSVSTSLSHASASTVDLPPATSRPSTSQSVCGRSTVVGEERTHSTLRPVTSCGETVVQPALRRSLFAAVPPTVLFVSEREKVEQLPWEIRKLLKWRMSPITPNVVKAVLRRSNFRITKKNHDWLGCFGKHMKASGFKAIREYQKLNHFPGSFQLGRKDRLWRNLSRMQVGFGKKEFGFFPQTYVLPQDLKHMKRTWEDCSARQKWIIKPPASARGLGIKVINKWSQIPRKRPVIVQKYLSKPLLINDSKFDMRVYVYVTSYHPLRAYIFEDGLARFASCKYSSSMKNLGNKFMHLTNYSINKHNANYQSNTDDNLCQGHKWSLKSLWNYLEKEGVDTQRLWDSIKDMVIKTLISADGSINTLIKANVRSRYTVHELFGFDILLDENLRPWILEVNISPSLHSSSPLDVSIKGQMVKDMMNLAGFRVPDKNDVVTGAHTTATLPELSAHVPSTDYCIDKRLFTNQLSADERAKHAYFCHRNQDEQVLQTILDTLTPDDVRILTESIDEDGRKGGFIRVFPTPSTKKYLRFFNQPRYYNLLLDQWVTRYNRMEQRGISILQGLCEDGVHLENPTSNPSHQWCPPHSAAALLSARDKNPSPLKKDPSGQKSSVSLTRLPKVRSGVGMGGEGSVSATIVGMPSPFTPLPVPRPPPRSLDPTR